MAARERTQQEPDTCARVTKIQRIRRFLQAIKADTLNKDVGSVERNGGDFYTKSSKCLCRGLGIATMEQSPQSTGALRKRGDYKCPLT